MIFFPFRFAQIKPHLKNFRSFPTALLFLFLFFPIGDASAQSDIENLASKEIVKRASAAKQSSEWINKAQRAWGDKNLEEAYKHYLAALDLLPPSSATADQRKLVMQSFCKVSMEYASSLIDRGRFADAESVAKTVLSSGFNPNYTPAAQLLSSLEQPGHYNRTITPKFAGKKDSLSVILNQAEGFFNTARYDLALKRYEEALNLDPYNTAARQGMEKVHRQRAAFSEASYNETRSRMLWHTDRQWERPVRKDLSLDRSTESRQQDSVSQKDAILRKLNETTIDKVELSNVSVKEAVDYLIRKSRELDTSTGDLKNKGVNIVLQLGQAKPSTSPATDPSAPISDQPDPSLVTGDSKISLSLRNVPLAQVIRYLAQVAGLNYRIEPYAVSLVPTSENTDDLFVKKFRVKPGFIPPTASADSGPMAGSASSSSNKRSPSGEFNAIDFFKGIDWPKGSYAQYKPTLNTLIVRNTQGALDLIGGLVDDDMSAAPSQVEIESKFVEISQTNFNELGFDYLFGPLSINNGIRGNGGTRSYSQELTADYYNNFPSGSVGQNPVTAGNRSGSGSSVNNAISANSLDSLLAGVASGSNSLSPGIFGLSGLFSQAEFQMVIRALNQKKGVDLMSAPKVSTKSGSKAIIKMVREFPYATEFTAPTLGESTSNSTATGLVQIGTPVVPTTPTTFEKREIGVKLEVEPQVGSDNYTIDLQLSPEVVEFDGFVNYGSPIMGVIFDQLLIPGVNLSGISTTVLTDNAINQPIFSVRKVQTSVSIWDGQTVALGGLIREDVQKVNDKVPILGDIPLAGRLFRSNVDQKIKRNLIIFVTARIMDAQGQPFKQENNDEDNVDLLGVPADLPPPTINTRSVGN
jgi:general secretion pathway protein D